MDKLGILKDIYERYSGRMLAICIRYCADRSVAHDIMHDGFIKIYNSLDRFEDRGEGSLRAWMSKIMVNESLQYLKRNDLLKDCADVERTSIEDDSDADASRIPEKVLMEFVTGLPPGYRAVFNLYVFENKSHKEIGEMLGIGEKTSSSQLYRARMILAEKVRQYERELR